MEITILGSAAAEGWPAVFCGCGTCKKVREAGGKDVRSRASVQIGPRHKIDLPPDTWFHEARLGADLSDLEYLFVTHSHQDHWSPGSLEYLREPFAHSNRLPLHVYGNDAVVRSGRQSLADHHTEEGQTVVYHEAEPLVPIEAGEITVTPITASHMTNEGCLNYVVNSGGRNVLCAWDTGWYQEEKTWGFLESLRLDCVILECTCGPNKCERYHMDFDHYFAVVERLRNAGTIAPGCVLVATHFSHNVGLLHEDLEHVLNPHGVLVAFDGMKIAL